MAIDRRSFIGGSAGLGLALGLSRRALAGELEPFDAPNIVCFVSEDNSINLGCYGDPLARTPNLDGFAARSIAFDNAFATTPVCGPLRFSIITGLYPASAGSAQNMGSDDTVMPRHFVQTPTPLRQMGYYCTNTRRRTMSRSSTTFACGTNPVGRRTGATGPRARSSSRSSTPSPRTRARCSPRARAP